MSIKDISFFKAVVFDWDDVLCFAKKTVALKDCLHSAVLSLKADYKSRVHQSTIEDIWYNITNESYKKELRSEWCDILYKIAKTLHQNDSQKRYLLILDLTCLFFDVAFKRLHNVYLKEKKNILSVWKDSALDDIARLAIPAFICSGTINEELLQETTLAGLAKQFKGIWGYPARKIDILRYIAKTLVCDPAKICMVDDSKNEIHKALCEGFAAILVYTHKYKNDRKKEEVDFEVAGLLTNSFKTALNSALECQEEIRLQEWAQDFLGSEVNIECIHRRFNEENLWRIYSTKSQKADLYCKIIRICRTDANYLGFLLHELSEQDLPITQWMMFGSDYAIELAPGRCVVIESALPGTPLKYEHHSNVTIESCARILARFHRAIGQVAATTRTYRQDFDQGLDYFDEIFTEFWKLNVYYHHTTLTQKCHQLQTMQQWLKENGEDIFIRIERLYEQLSKKLSDHPCQLIFGDFNCTNLLFEGNTLTGVVDYEEIHYGPRELDVISYCMYGTSELHFPNKLDTFVKAYNKEFPDKLDISSLGLIAKAVANTRLIRKLRKYASDVCIEEGQSDYFEETPIIYLNNLCIALDDFEYIK